MGPLSPAWLKWVWANDHFEKLMTELAESDHQVRLRGEFNPDETRYTLYALSVPDVPQTVPLRVGDIVYNFRCVLDYIAHILTGHASPDGEPWERSQYPLADDPARYSR